MTNGIGSESLWLNIFGYDDSLSNQVTCSIYQLEKEDYKVRTLEVGYLNVGQL